MNRFSIVIVLLIVCGFSSAQQPQTAGKTPGQSTPPAASGSSLPQAGQPLPPNIPGTTPAAGAAANNAKNEPDPFLDTPPLPTTGITLVGGTVRSIDHIRDHMTVVPFAGKAMKMVFDDRTHIYRDGIETTFMGIQKGDRVYVDTQLDHAAVFARNVHVITEAHAADARGQIVALRDDVLTLQDQLSGQPVSFQVGSGIKVMRKTEAASLGDLVPGALVTIQFSADQANRRVVRQVSILAKPGDPFKFFGQVTHLDLSKGIIAVRNFADDQTYEINFSPAVTPATADLRVGTQVVVDAMFTGRGYRASDVSVTQAKVSNP